jgi:hypothetical protein
VRNLDLWVEEQVDEDGWNRELGGGGGKLDARHMNGRVETMGSRGSPFENSSGVLRNSVLYAAERQHDDLRLSSVGNGGLAAGLRKMRGENKVRRSGSTVAPDELTRTHPWRWLTARACATMVLAAKFTKRPSMAATELAREKFARAETSGRQELCGSFEPNAAR